MRRVSLFVEDQAHYEFLNALLLRLAGEYGIGVRLDWRNARRGHGMVIRELRQYLRDLLREREDLPDLVVVATDANCKGMNERIREVAAAGGRGGPRLVCAVPDPHIERWLLLDSAAFKQVFGRGCDPPDRKCERARYKKKLLDSIVAAGIVPALGGMEYADEIVRAMDLARAGRADQSLARLLDELRAVFRQWR